MIFTAVIEQTYAYAKRMKYIAETNSFIEKKCDSLSYIRNVKQPYGWIKESGTPPNPHLDVIIMTDNIYELGDEIAVKVIGVFQRADGDNKLIACLSDREIDDFWQLSESEKEDLHRLYPNVRDGEGWFGKEIAEEIITEHMKKYAYRN